MKLQLGIVKSTARLAYIHFAVSVQPSNIADF